MPDRLRVTVAADLRVARDDAERFGLRLADLADPFRYENPDWWKLRRMGRWTGATAKHVTLVESLEGEGLSLPRGVWTRLRAHLGELGVPVELVDRRADGDPVEFRWVAPFRLNPDQVSAARQLLKRGGGIVVGPCACLHGDTRIYDPIAGSTLTVEERHAIGDSFHVYSLTRHGPVIGIALPPKRYPITEMLDVVTEVGTVRVTPAHRVWTGEAWIDVRSLGELRRHAQLRGESVAVRLASNSACDLEARVVGGRHLKRIIADSRVGCRLELRSGGEPLRFEATTSRGISPSRVGVHEPTCPEFWQSLRLEPGRTHPCRSVDLPCSLDYVFRSTHPSETHSGIARLPERSGRAELDSDTCRESELLRPFLDRIGTTEQLRVDVRSSTSVEDSSCSCTGILAKVLEVRNAQPAEYYDFHVPRWNNYWAEGLWHHNSGKTEIGVYAIALAGRRACVVVPTEPILDGWRETAEARLPGTSVGVLYGRRKQPDAEVVVALPQTLANLVSRDPAYAARFGTFVLDEAHHAPATTFAKVVGSFPARHRWALTATPKRKDGKEQLFYDAFGSDPRPPKPGRAPGKAVPRVVYELTDEDLDRYGRIVPVDVVVVPTDFYFDLFHSDRMHLDGFKRRKGESTQAAARRYAKAGRELPPAEWHDYLDALADDRTRQARVLEFLLSEHRAGRTSLLLADRREASLATFRWLKRRGIPCGKLMGGPEKRGRREAEAALAEGKLLVAVGTTAIAGEGLNIKRLAAGFAVTPSASNPGRFVQNFGRFKRKADGKDRATFYYFWDRRISELRPHAELVRRLVKPPHRAWFADSPERDAWRPLRDALAAGVAR